MASLVSFAKGEIWTQNVYRKDNMKRYREKRVIHELSREA